jgi:hypothetical protein
MSVPKPNTQDTEILKPGPIPLKPPLSKHTNALESKFCTSKQVNILKIRRLPDDVSIYSLAGSLHKIPASLNDALLGASTKAVASPWIGNDLAKDSVSFYRSICAVDTSFDIVEVTDKNGTVSKAVRFSNWSTVASENINCIDVMEDVILAACNAKRLEHAVAMLQVAFAMKAVSLLITHDAFLVKSGASCLRAVPFVSVSKMFATVKFDPDMHISDSTIKTLTVDSGCVYHDDDGPGSQPILFDISIDPTITECDDIGIIETRPSQDFPFMMGFTSPKFHVVTATFGEKAPKERVEAVLRFYLDVSKRSASSSVTRSSGVCKRKLNAMSFS